MVKPLIALIALVGLFVVGIIVPNFVQAKNRSHQNRSLADLRTIATAWEARATDVQTYAVGAKHRDVVVEKTLEWNALTPVPSDALRKVLEPTYVKTFPANDGWGHAFQFAAGDQTYAIRTLGQDGQPDGAVYAMSHTTAFDGDSVYSNGSFLVGPEGI